MEFSLHLDDGNEVGKATITDIDSETVLLTGDEIGRQELSFAAAREAIKDGSWRLVAELMTQEQFKELKKIVADLPRYHNNLGSTPFRDRAAEIAGRRPRGIRKYTLAESAKLIEVLDDERSAYLIEKGKVKEELDSSE